MTHTKLFAVVFVVAAMVLGGAMAHAQYAPPQAGMLGVGSVTESTIEWTFSAGGGLVTEAQLFVGDEAAPRMTVAVAQGNPMSITERALIPGKKYEDRRVRLVYYGTPGPLSGIFPATRTLPPIPVPSISPVEVFSPNLMFDVGETFDLANGVEWQVWNDTEKSLHNWVKTRWLQIGPFAAGKTYVFKYRSRDIDGRVTAWSSNMSYVMPASLPIPPAPLAPTTRFLSAVAGLRVRALPSLTGKILTVIRPGKAYPVLESRDGWHRLQITPALSGWSFGKYLK